MKPVSWRSRPARISQGTCARPQSSYSPNNVLLILSQRPDATRVAGYTTWQSLGRQVKKGEKAIYIFAPRPYRVTTEDEAGEEQTRGGLTFRSVPVVDLEEMTHNAPPVARLLPMNDRMRGEGCAHASPAPARRIIAGVRVGAGEGPALCGTRARLPTLAGAPSRPAASLGALAP